MQHVLPRLVQPSRATAAQSCSHDLLKGMKCWVSSPRRPTQQEVRAAPLPKQQRMDFGSQPRPPAQPNWRPRRVVRAAASANYSIRRRRAARMAPKRRRNFSRPRPGIRTRRGHRRRGERGRAMTRAERQGDDSSKHAPAHQAHSAPGRVDDTPSRRRQQEGTMTNSAQVRWCLSHCVPCSCTLMGA